MKKLFAIMIFALAATYAQAAEPDAADKAAIRTVVEAQLAAFKQDDASAAFSFASPRIKAIFKDADNFMRMVKQDYQPVYRPKAVSFRNLETIEGNLVQPVLVIGPSGAPVTALYIMEKQDDGSWLIGGCVLAQEPDKPI